MTRDEVEENLLRDGHVEVRGNRKYFNSYAEGYMDCFDILEAKEKLAIKPIKIEPILSIKTLGQLQEYNNINVDAFNEWMAYKKYKNKGAITKTLNMLNKYDYKTQQEMVDKSIMNEYKGLFEPKKQKSRTDNNANVAKSWLDENDFHEMCRPKEISHVK